jgi:hypothetical protein
MTAANSIPNTQLPDRMEVRGSLPKLIAFGVVAAPFALVLVLMAAMALITLYLRRSDLFYDVIVMGTTPVLVSGLICWWYISLWRTVKAHDPFFVFMPEGLVMPSLGSDKPIPWEDVRTAWSHGFAAGPWSSFVLEVSADPSVYPKLFRPFMQWWIPDRAGDKVTIHRNFHGAFDLGVKKLRETIDRYKERYAMSEEKKKKAEAMNASTMTIVAAALVTGLIAFSVIFSMFSPFDTWITYAIICAVWSADAVVFSLLYARFKQSPKSPSKGLVWSGFGEQRPAIGTMKKRG